MKILGTDYSLKNIFFKIDDTTYMVLFRSSFFKGVYDVEIHTGKRPNTSEFTEASHITAYPGLKERVRYLLDDLKRVSYGRVSNYFGDRLCKIIAEQVREGNKKCFTKTEIE